ncbi:NAD(P)H-dependent oxidoreductase [bacterium]|jgi:multimeric flavodoxin WrbA|nr:NAD(P)H-dependent oxidoreductase [bacterium]MBT6293476.1 NAD(P)H-dependent oxidoreductase [bacterium]
MKIAVISGSHRACETDRISLFVKEELEKKGVEVFHYSLKDNPLPLWSEDAWDDESDLVKNTLNDLQENISSCDAYVVMSPEWGGMVTPGLKNFMLMSGGFMFKPAYLIGVSASRGGAYPIAELRMSSYKNNQIMYLPEHLIVRDCANMFNDKADDSYLRKRLDYGLNLLIKHAELLAPLQDSGLINLEDYPYGM